MAWAAAIAGIVGAAGSIGGAVAGQTKTPDLPKKITNRDPILNQLSIESMLALGIPVSAEQIQRSSPLGQLGNKKLGRDLVNLVNQGQAAGLSLDEIMASIDSAGTRKKGGGFVSDVGGRIGALSNDKQLGKFLANSGYSSLRDLVQADLAYSEQATEQANQYSAAQPGIAQGRIDALSRVAGIQSDFVAPTGAQLASQSQEIETALRAQIAREFGEQGQAALYQANSLGINPAGRLSRLDEGQALANLAAGPDALARTLQLLSGRQGLQSNAINALQGSLQQGTNNASNLIGMRMNQNSQSANQALQLAGLQSQNNQILGQGIQGAANNVGAVPGLIQENQRRQQIDAYYGIGTPVPTSQPGERVSDREFDEWMRNNG